jgi:WD40 repeat protein
VSAVDTFPEVRASDSPYIGLTFYTQQDAAMFFGRESEQTVLISNLRASRLTLLYAQSGAGKSSLLRAGVASRLAELAQRSFSQRGTARNIPVVFSSWRDDPTVDLIGEIQKAISPFVRAVPRPASPPDQLDAAIEAASEATDATLLDAAIKAASEDTDATLLVILDQFEEYFLYRSREARDRPFADELAACLNRPDLRVHFLISIREDAYSGLGDLFKGRINNVYGNYFHLDHLTREAAREAIEKPVASFNELHPDQAPVEIEPGLVDAVLDQLRPDQFASDQGGVGRLADGNGAEPIRDEVAAPYLQLVMKRIWDTELGQRSTRLRLETLTELGGAQTIVRTHVDRALGSLTDEDREAAVDMLHHLVTPSGTKIALAASDLAEYTSRSADDTNALLERLAGSDIRILRPVPAAPGGTGETRFEISHDLLAPAILDWGRRRRAVRLEHEKEAAERQVQTEKKRARMFRGLAIGSAVLLAAATVLAITATSAEQSAQSARSQAESRGMLATAEAELSQDPELATMLALRAVHLSDTSQSEAVLREALPQLQLKTTLTPPPPQRSAVFSADGTRILTATADGTVHIWDSASDKQLVSFPGFGPLNDAAFSPSGTSIVIANNDGNARILNARTGQVTGILTPSGNTGFAVSSAAFSPDGALIVTTYADGTARLWNVRAHKQVGPTLSADHGTPLLSAAFSPDGKLVVTASSDGKARIYDAQTGTQLGMVHRAVGLESAAFSPDGKFVAVASGDGTATIWNASTDQLVSALTPPGYTYIVFSAAFSPDGRQIVTASSDGAARIWDVASGRLVRTLGMPGHDSLQTAAFSPDGKSIVTASAGGVVRVWDAVSGRQIALLTSPEAGSNRLLSAALSPDGTLAVTGSQFGTVTAWKVPHPGPGAWDWNQINVISMPEGDAVNGVAFSSDGKLLATANQSGAVYVWQFPSGLPEVESTSAWGRPLNSVMFDPVNSNLIVTADDDGYARIINLSTDKQVGKSFGVRGSEMYAAAFSPDGKRIVTAGANGYAQVWNASSQKPIGGDFGYGSPIYSAQFSHDGTEIVTTEEDGYTEIWDATQTPPSFDLEIQEPESNVPHDAVFSPDGSAVVTAGTDGTAREWNADTGGQMLAFAGHTGEINTVAISGTELITASSDGTAKIWNAEPVEQRGLLPGPSDDTIYTATFDPANPRIVATADDSSETVSIWNTGDQKAALKVLNVPGVSSAEFSANGKLLVTAGNEHVQIWRMSNLAHPESSFDTAGCPSSNGNTPSLNGATFSKDGDRVVTADADGSACAWNISNGLRVQTFTEPAGVSGGVAGGLGVGGSPVKWAVFSPDGKQVLTASGDGTARLWDLGSGRQLQVFYEPTGESMNSAWFSPDGTTIVTSSDDGMARIWSAATGTLVQTLSGPDRSPVYNAAFSGNGQLVVTCSADAAAIWSAQTGQQLTAFQHGVSLSDCEFSPDSSKVITAGQDGQTRIFSAELAGGMAGIESIAEQRAAHLLTAAEQKEYQAAAG